MQRLHTLLALLPELLQSGLLDPSGGSLAVRTSKGIYVSPFQAGELLRWKLSLDDFVLFPGEGDASMGRAGRHPGREARLHRALLAARPDWNAVWHGHPWGLLSFSLAARRLPVPPAHSRLLKGGKPAEVPVAGDGGAPLVPETVVEVLCSAFAGSENGAVLLAGHGPLVAGVNVESVFSLAQSLENLARAQQHLL